jgi:ribosome-associated protein
VTSDAIEFGEWSIPGAEIEERFDTSGGPGGQHANKTETAVTIRFDIAASSLPEATQKRLMRRLGPVVEVTASDTRSQWRNREIVRERLKQRLERALVVEKPRKKTKPSKAAKERRMADKKAHSEKKTSRRRPDLD